MLNSARGYIPPEEWDEGIPAALVNYSFTGSRGSDTDSYFLSMLSGLNYGPWRQKRTTVRGATPGATDTTRKVGKTSVHGFSAQLSR